MGFLKKVEGFDRSLIITEQICVDRGAAFYELDLKVLSPQLTFIYYPHRKFGDNVCKLLSRRWHC